MRVHLANDSRFKYRNKTMTTNPSTLNNRFLFLHIVLGRCFLFDSYRPIETRQRYPIVYLTRGCIGLNNVGERSGW